MNYAKECINTILKSKNYNPEYNFTNEFYLYMKNDILRVGQISILGVTISKKKNH
jgi:hypothetical protein